MPTSVSSLVRYVTPFRDRLSNSPVWRNPPDPLAEPQVQGRPTLLLHYNGVACKLL